MSAFLRGVAETLDLQPAAQTYVQARRRREDRKDKLEDEQRALQEKMATFGLESTGDRDKDLRTVAQHQSPQGKAQRAQDAAAYAAGKTDVYSGDAYRKFMARGEYGQELKDKEEQDREVARLQLADLQAKTPGTPQHLEGQGHKQDEAAYAAGYTDVYSEDAYRQFIARGEYAQDLRTGDDKAKWNDAAKYALKSFGINIVDEYGNIKPEELKRYEEALSKRNSALNRRNNRYAGTLTSNQSKQQLGEALWNNFGSTLEDELDIYSASTPESLEDIEKARTAISKFEVNPTESNLDKANEAMEALRHKNPEYYEAFVRRGDEEFETISNEQGEPPTTVRVSTVPEPPAPSPSAPSLIETWKPSLTPSIGGTNPNADPAAVIERGRVAQEKYVASGELAENDLAVDVAHRKAMEQGETTAADTLGGTRPPVSAAASVDTSRTVPAVVADTAAANVGAQAVPPETTGIDTTTNLPSPELGKSWPAFGNMTDAELKEWAVKNPQNTRGYAVAIEEMKKRPAFKALFKIGG